jgi:hypothetical protein
VLSGTVAKVEDTVDAQLARTTIADIAAHIGQRERERGSAAGTR